MNDILDLINDWAMATKTSTIANFNFQTTYFSFEFVRAIKCDDGYVHGYKVSRVLPLSYIKNFQGSEDMVITSLLKEVDNEFKKVEVKEDGAE